MSNEDKTSGWFTNLVAGFFGLISVGHEKVDLYVKSVVKLLILFIVLTVLIFAAGSAFLDWVEVLRIDVATEAVGAAFSEAVQQAAPVTPTEVPALE